MRGVFLALQLFTEPGDEIVINPPVYQPFFSTIAYAGRQVVEAPLTLDPETATWKLDLEAIERAFAQGARAHLFCSPHNPVGRVWSRDDLAALADLAEAHGVRMIVDEVHAPLVYDRGQFIPFGSLDSPAARDAVVFTSASKAWNLAGLKCAMAVASSKAVADRFRGLPDEVRIEPSILGIAANEVAFQDGVPWLDDTVAYLGGNLALLGELLAQHLPEVRWSAPEATFLAWLDCRALDLGDGPAKEFLARGRVALTAGEVFGTGGQGFARITFATSRAILHEAVQRMAASVGRGSWGDAALG